MENFGRNKISGIRQIVRLKGFLQKWQNAALGSNSKRNYRELNKMRHDGGISPAISLRLRSFNTCCDSDEDNCMSPEPAHGIPKGYLAVYVGPELRRFIIPTSYLVDPLFKVLLEKVEEEFGFDHSGALKIPCEIETFKYLLNVMENRQKNQGANEDLNSAERRMITAE